MARLLLILPTLLLGGCGHLFFWPEPGLRLTPDRIGHPYQDVTLQSHDGITLHGWWLPARLEADQAAHGIVYFLHGNAENISTHLGAMSWITRHGWHLFILDYRGYGLSEGTPSIASIHLDARSGLDWSLAQARALQLPLVVFGQSLGGSTAVTTLATDVRGAEVDALIIDSAFAGHRRIIRDKLQTHWLTWPLAHPLAWTVPDRFSPERHIARRPPFPMLILHSCADPVIPCEHGKRLAHLAGEPHTLWLDDQAPHIGMLGQRQWREALLDWLDAHVRGEARP